MSAATLPLWWQQLLLVMAGGALGAAGRYWLGEALLRQIGNGIPWGTLTVNLVGSFLVGFMAVWLDSRGPSGIYWKALLIVGVLGAFTTYSALMLECLIYLRSDRAAWMLGYLATTSIFGLLLVWGGARLAEWMR